MERKKHLEFLKSNTEGQIVQLETKISFAEKQMEGVKDSEALKDAKVQVDALKTQLEQTNKYYTHLCQHPELSDSESAEETKKD